MEESSLSSGFYHPKFLDWQGPQHAPYAGAGGQASPIGVTWLLRYLELMLSKNMLSKYCFGYIY